MSERERQRRLHVQNRLEELRRKHGNEHEWVQLPMELDTLEGWHARMAQDHAQQAQEPPEPMPPAQEPPPPSPAPGPSQGPPAKRQVWDRW